MNWLMQQKLEQREQRITLEELLGAVRRESERVERLEQAIRDATPEWSLAGVVHFASRGGAAQLSTG
jgi:hypothetical protein